MPYKNPEDHRKRSQKYYREHCEQIKAKKSSQRKTDEGREKERKYRHKYYWKNRERLKANFRRKNLMKAYGITPEEFHQIWINQKGKCAICNLEIKEIDNKTHLDHCHKTGKVRGILCSHCNALLGFCRENKSVLKNAIIYLEGDSDGKRKDC